MVAEHFRLNSRWQEIVDDHLQNGEIAVNCPVSLRIAERRYVTRVSNRVTETKHTA